MTYKANPLYKIDEDIAAHWEEHRPKMTARLKAAGQFEQAVKTAAALTTEAVITYNPPGGCNGGQIFWEAWELFREEWAFLPAEEDVPEPGIDPVAWEMPIIPDEDA